MQLPQEREEPLLSGLPACIGDSRSRIYGDGDWFGGWLSNNACRHWTCCNYCQGGCTETMQSDWGQLVSPLHPAVAADGQELDLEGQGEVMIASLVCRWFCEFYFTG